MEGQLQSSPDLGYALDSDDAKYVSRLSTILVATIQEAKDRISQIEYIFCSQLFPNFQLKSKTLAKIYAEAKKAADDAHSEKQNDLLLQMEKLQLEKKQAMELNQSLLKEHDEKSYALLAKVSNLEKRVEELGDELMKKTEEVIDGKKLNGNLLKKIDCQALEMMTNEQLVTKGEKLQQELHQQVERNGLEILEKTEELEQCEQNKRLLQVKCSQLEEKFNLLQAGQRETSSIMTKEMYEALIEQIEAKETELQAMRKKRRDVVDKYKSLKSQYNFLLKKVGFIEDDAHPRNKLESGIDPFKHHLDAKSSPDSEDEKPGASKFAFEINKVKNEIVDSMVASIQAKPNETSKFQYPTFRIDAAPKSPIALKSAPVAGTKRTASSWRDTRPIKCKDGPDPHDDFLNTPIENIRGNLSKAMKKAETNAGSSDDETQDMNVDPIPQKKQMPVTTTNDKRGYKYVEPVRKKAERENLKGVECNQCKKFYDAILPNGGGDNQSLRCEHQDGVSRHRYRYIPPSTPEGFWNIGFESEM